MSSYKSATTLIDAKRELSTDGDKIEDAATYMSLAGALQYLTITRPDLAFAVQQLCLHMHNPRVPHLALLKHLLRYVRLQHPLALLKRDDTQTTGGCCNPQFCVS